MNCKACKCYFWTAFMPDIFQTLTFEYFCDMSDVSICFNVFCIDDDTVEEVYMVSDKAMKSEFNLKSYFNNAV